MVAVVISFFFVFLIKAWLLRERHRHTKKNHAQIPFSVNNIGFLDDRACRLRSLFFLFLFLFFLLFFDCEMRFQQFQVQSESFTFWCDLPRQMHSWSHGAIREVIAYSVIVSTKRPDIDYQVLLSTLHDTIGCPTSKSIKRDGRDRVRKNTFIHVLGRRLLFHHRNFSILLFIAFRACECAEAVSAQAVEVDLANSKQKLWKTVLVRECCNRWWEKKFLHRTFGHDGKRF